MQIVIPVGYNKDFPVTKRPQTFLSIAGKEVFSSILEKLKDHEVIVITPFPKEFKKYEVQVLKDEFTGSASALRAMERVMDGTFMVHYSDIFTPLRVDPLINFHERTKPLITLGLHSAKNPWRYSVVSTDPTGMVVRFLHDPRPDLVFSNTVSTGMMVMEPEVFDKIPYKMDMQELINYLVQRKMPVYGYEFGAFWYHLGSVPEYVEANRDYLKRRMEMTHENVTGINIYPPVSLDGVSGDAAFVGPYVSARDVHIGKGSKILNTTIYPGTVIGENVNISDSILGPNVKIEDNAVVTESLVGEKSHVGPNVKVGRSVVGVEREIMSKIFETKLI
ncbi:MAG: NDP-sugar synthase [Candidatus Altiarchaeota archaeon]|nr:NDP-sugar synthase [Candidatus Altiarchaeota archaeon]